MDIFLHIGKTGGTTLSFPLRRLYGLWRTHHVGNKDRDGVRPTSYCNLSATQKRKVRLIKGHILYGAHNYSPNHCRYFTLFRHPVDRVASFHRMLQKEMPNSRAGQMSLGEYIEKDARAHGRNAQLRIIAGRPPEAGSCNQDTLEQAIQHLKDHFPVFGLTERYDESLILMKRRLGWDAYPYYVTSRVGKDGNGEKEEREVDPEVEARIKERNELDVKLYNYAQERFEEMIKAEGPGFQEEVNGFQKRNRFVGAASAVPLRIYRRVRRLFYLLRQ